MPWSRQRAFDRDYAQAMTEIDATVARLRARGATRIVIGGHSLGTAAALIYCAQRPADGLLLLALGHSPQSSTLQERFAASVARARQPVADGKGEEADTFDDFDSSKTPPACTIRTTTRIYLSYFDPKGGANTLDAIRRLPAALPLLWITGSRENAGLKSYGERLYAAVATPHKRYAEVEAGHVDVPGVAGSLILEWLATLP